VKAYNLAEFFVLATLYESFSLPLVEAMSCGCPALVPETGACPEVGGDAAVYVNPLDPEAIGRAMRKISESKELRMQMRKAGMKRASLYTWDHTAKITLDDTQRGLPDQGHFSEAGRCAATQRDTMKRFP
jgi:glycosyltransferase involved in cell wall biosynthesis